jgi:hypothetical protein
MDKKGIFCRCDGDDDGSCGGGSGNGGDKLIFNKLYDDIHCAE